MISTKDLFAHAMEMHQAGRIDVALTSFTKIVAHEPANPEALYWIGCIHNQRGEYDRAVEVLKRAIVERPGVPSFHVALAESFRNLGGLKRAAGCCRTALKLKPDYPEALCTFGLVLQALGRPAEAADQFRRASSCGLILRRRTGISRWCFGSWATGTSRWNTCAARSTWRPGTRRRGAASAWCCSTVASPRRP